MLATLVIGLREGLEAALIVGIIAAFLRKNGKSLLPMWIGVIAAVVLSIAVGVALSLVEQALPQAAQEGMESVIGAVAVVFVTGMIVWMNTHARGMKKELEGEAAEALGQGGAYALAVMAFLAVLKEGFETSVFLLATFSAAQSALLAAVGAVLGVLGAVAIGWGIYAGGVRLNLSRFFRATGAFLILVAAGLVVTTLRTAHEAGWLNAGQQPTVQLSWLVQPGTVQSALITGVLGVPADPRLIEVVGWFAYLIPVALFVYWPTRFRPSGAAAVRLRFVLAGVFALAAVALAVLVPVPRLEAPATVSLVAASDSGGGSSVGTARLVGSGGAASVRVSRPGQPAQTVALPAASAQREDRDGLTASRWDVKSADAPEGRPATLTLDELVTLAGGRLPVGVDPQQNPGPFSARWSSVSSTTVWLAEGALLDASGRTTTVVTISGGGLGTSRTVTASGDASSEWQVAPADVQRTASAVAALDSARAECALWAVAVPVALLVAAVALAIAGLRARRRLSATAAASAAPADAAPNPSPSPESAGAVPGSDPQQRSTSYAAH